MKFTNKHGLPKPLVEALTGRDFDLSRVPDNIFWLTRLLNPPKIAELEKRHWDELEVDVSERLNLLIGKGVHNEVQRHTDHSERLTEEKAYIRVSDMSVHTIPLLERLKDQEWYDTDEIYISCRLDYYGIEDGKGVVDDYKTGSVWQAKIDKGPKPDQELQVNVYGWVLRQIGFTVDELRLSLLMKDWSLTKASREAAYPQFPIACWQVFQRDDEEIVDIIRSRVKEHVAAMALEDDDIPECSEADRWAKPATYAVMKAGRKSAMKLHKTKDAANDYAAELARSAKKGESFYVEERKAQNVRCESYCHCRSFCHFYKNVGGVR